MTIYEYKDPIIAQMRSGLPDDPYVPITEQFKIIKNMVVLTEIPDEFTGVSVSGEGVTWIENKTGVLAENEYYVDYTLGVVRFHPSKEGLTPTFNYLGRGAFFFPASRVWSLQKDGSVVETLEELVKISDNFNHKGDYDPTVSYKARNIVNYLGGTYMCILDTTPGIDPTNEQYWRKITSFVYRGVYSPNETYKYGDFVVDEAREKLYMCIVNTSIGNPLTDTTKWVMSIDISDVVANARQATYDANTAADNANTAAANANNAADSANVAADLANNAAMAANDAAFAANTAATEANNQANYAKTQGDYAKSVGDSLVHRGDFNDQEVYVTRNIVFYQGSTYICISDPPIGTPPTDVNYWRKLTAYRWMDIYSPTVTYQYGDTVTDSQGVNIYQCIVESSTNIPLTDGTNWKLILSIEDVVNSANEATTNANNAAANAQNLVDTLVHLGDWDINTQYEVNNEVRYRGSTYRCIATPPVGTLPTDTNYWTLVAAKGTDGIGGDMYKNIYDQNDDGVVDNAEKLGGQLPSFYARAEDLNNHISAPDPHPQYAKDGDPQPPTPHASTHAVGGSDPITPGMIGAETPEGAQAKADAIKAWAMANGLGEDLTNRRETVDANNCLTTGMYFLARQAENRPPDVLDGQMLVLAHSSIWLVQILVDNRTGDIWTRNCENGTWETWKKFWNGDNDGAGSGLDADLLDGMQPSTAASANTIVQRDASGRIKAAAPSASDDVIRLNEYNSTLRRVSAPGTRNCNDFLELNAFFVWDTGNGDFQNTPLGYLAQGTAQVFVVKNFANSTNRIQQEFAFIYPRTNVRIFRRNRENSTWGPWYEVWHSGNHPKITVSSTAPSNPAVNDIWIQT